MTIVAIATLGFAIPLMLLLVRAWFALGGSTLRAPLGWAGLTVCLLTATALSPRIAAEATPASSAVRFVFAAETLCPLVAVLGAKRPQDRGWQWVVASLWLVVAWPALQTLLLPAGPRLELFPAWKLFLLGLVALGPLNYLPTRHALASLLVVGGQLIVLSSFLYPGASHQRSIPIGVGSFLLAALLVWLRSAVQPDDKLTARWLAFRDAYGAFWALRIQHRLNETAALRSWPVCLQWGGFTSTQKPPPDVLSPSQVGEIDCTLDTLLRRFEPPKNSKHSNLE